MIIQIQKLSELLFFSAYRYSLNFPFEHFSKICVLIAVHKKDNYNWLFDASALTKLNFNWKKNSSNRSKLSIDFRIAGIKYFKSIHLIQFLFTRCRSPRAINFKTNAFRKLHIFFLPSTSYSTKNSVSLI